MRGRGSSAAFGSAFRKRTGVKRISERGAKMRRDFMGVEKRFVFNEGNLSRENEG